MIIVSTTQLQKITVHVLCAPELLPEKKEQAANWFNSLSEQYAAYGSQAEHLCHQEPLQVSFSPNLLL